MCNYKIPIATGFRDRSREQVLLRSMSIMKSYRRTAEDKEKSLVYKVQFLEFGWRKLKLLNILTCLKSEVDKKLRVSFVICSQSSEFPRFLAYAPTHVVTFRASDTATASLRFIVFLSIFWTISSVVSYYESIVFEKSCLTNNICCCKTQMHWPFIAVVLVGSFL